MEDLQQYLVSFINKSEHGAGLLPLFSTHLHCSIVSLFVCVDRTSAYKCLAHYNTQKTHEPQPTFQPSWLDNIQIGTSASDIYECETAVTTHMFVPLSVDGKHIGAVIFCNQDPDLQFQTDFDTYLTSLLSLAQLIVSREKLICEQESIYSDKNYFSKDLFLANMSHEIKTPLHGIIGYTQLLQQSPLDLPQQNYLQQVNDCALHLMRIINDVLDFSKLASGNMLIKTDRVLIKEIIADTQRAVIQMVLLKKQQLTYTVSENIPQWVIVDKQKIVQIIVNLITNASKFSNVEDKIKVKINLQIIKTVSYLEIHVIDQGIGIPKSEHCKLFNSFVQIQQSLTKNGTGLGLAISKKLAELLKGTIQVQSQVGKGSTFTLLCPFVEHLEFNKQTLQQSPVIIGKRILLVDDTLENRMMISNMLFEWGTRTVMCSGGEEALTFLNDPRFVFDVGLIDICMPNMSGVELAAKIKQICPNLPLIALSSLSSFVNLEHFIHKLDKPFNKNHLLYILNSMFHREEIKPLQLEIADYQVLPLTGLRNLRILVVEDVNYNRSLLVNMLKLLKYQQIDEVADGVEAIKILQVESYDVVFLDLRMPRLDGFGVIQFMNKKKIMTTTTVVAVTASVIKKDRQQCQESGVQYFIEKPIQMNKLKQLVLYVATHQPQPISPSESQTRLSV
jgi:signal transduction histidine kinase/DNA-binding response OmpR family regulator